MPEGNTVWLTARTLDNALAGRRLVSADIRLPALATADLTGREVIDVTPRGKHLLIRLSTVGEGPPLTLHSHLRMDGAWRVRPAGPIVRTARDDVRVVLGTADATAVGYRLHDVALVPTSAEDQLVGHLGPDLLGPDWDAAVAVRNLAREPARAIAEAVLDQRNLAGAGNVYKCESCFLAGVSPWTPVGDVDLPKYVDLVHRLLFANKQRYNHLTTGDDRPGRRTWVYGRDGRPCLRCGTPIRRWDATAAQDRVTYWCPSCQPGPAPNGAQHAALTRSAAPRPPGRRRPTG
ncbi:MAG TPA: DNA-formamidopyrimidine glycosylase family protein [Acidothermaceae bacterium]|nr:DNA-formamidopyrimidine glycosylase family protein [Acidothermaceae bacterium]